ncbi:MAG: amidohydrolase [Deltaproteobacteria bacterium]|nr:amidohydrolase [Deltaproteobacteria bacterium]
MASGADLAFVNGRVITVNPRNEVVQAVSIQRNRIVAVGSNHHVRKTIGPETEVIDLAGKTLVPGFIDPHIHLAHYGRQRQWLDVTHGAVRSIRDIAELVARRVAEIPRGEWVLGRGFNPSRLAERRVPTHVDLDPVSPDHPVGLQHASGMSWTFNGEGLRRLGVRADTPDPPGGHIDRDEHGVPLGPLWDNCRTFIIEPKLPKPTEDDLYEGARWTCSELNRFGITSAHEADLKFAIQLRAWQRLREAGELRLRVNFLLYTVRANFWESDTAGGRLFEAGIRTGFGDEWLRLGPICIGVDGSGLGQTAALFEPYANDPRGEYRGSVRMTQEELDAFCLKVHAAGCQIAAVAIGERGIEMAIEAIGKAVSAVPRENHRHRLEHGYLWNAGQIRRAAALGLVHNSGGPPLLQAYGVDSTIGAWGPQRALRGFPFRSLLDAGLIVTGGSDAPVAAPDPMKGIDCLVTRRLDPRPDAPVLNPAERVSVLQAVRMYTYNGAYSSFEEHLKGSLEVGKLADLAVLSEDILRIDPEEVRHLRTIMTVLDGKVVYHE